jgi:hypothetical protein
MFGLASEIRKVFAVEHFEHVLDKATVYVLAKKIV